MIGLSLVASSIKDLVLISRILAHLDANEAAGGIFTKSVLLFSLRGSNKENSIQRGGIRTCKKAQQAAANSKKEETLTGADSLAPCSSAFS